MKKLYLGSWIVGLAGILISGGCGGGGTQTVGGPKRESVLLQDVTLDNALRHVPEGQDYIEAQGHGVAPEGEKDQQVRRRISENSAVIDAQKKLIQQLEGMVPKNRITDILRQARLGDEKFLYDDACDLTLRIPKDAVVGKPPIQ